MNDLLNCVGRAESAAVTNALIKEFNKKHGTDGKPALTGLPFRKKQ